jgi:hypothetical protein
MLTDKPRSEREDDLWAGQDLYLHPDDKPTFAAID